MTTKQGNIAFGLNTYNSSKLEYMPAAPANES